LNLAATLLAQGQSLKPIEIKPIGISNQSDGPFVKNNKASQQQFGLVAHQEAMVSLQFTLKKEGAVSVLVKDKRDRVVYAKQFHRLGNNTIELSMDEEEEYILLLTTQDHEAMTVNFQQKGLIY
ncbi:hypothetical protein, partial [Flavobacterium sp.]|uniref:hypothetical protein n=1 Tax=Flavobacterium sp. TaxID=239 RepID=UPI002FDDF067